MKTTFRLLLMSFLFMGISFAQQRECSTMENLEYRKQLDPGLQKRMNDIEKFTQKKKSNK